MNQKLVSLGENANMFQKLPLMAGIALELLGCYLMKPIEQGAAEMTGEEATMIL